MNDKKNEKINSLQEEFNKIQEDNRDLDVNMYMAKLEDLPELGDIQIYNYESDIVEVKERANNVLDSLVDMFLGDVPKLLEHPYIKNKVQEYALDYAESLLLTKMTRKILISQMRSIDNGANGARENEVVNQTIQQMRENIKFSKSQKTNIEKSYIDLRRELGITEIENKVEESKEDGNKEESMILDNRKMNDLIANIIKKNT